MRAFRCRTGREDCDEDRRDQPDGLAGGPAAEDVPASAGTAGDDSEAGRWGASLGIPTILDRVAQAAAKLVIEPIFEADLDDSAYGCRPRRGAVDVVRKVHGLLCQGYTDVVDADLSKYFATIPHGPLMQSVARRIVDRHMLKLIRLWLKAPVEESTVTGVRRLTGGRKHRLGTPQGGVISPLLANLYMNRFLKHWRGTDRTNRFRAEVIAYRRSRPGSTALCTSFAARTG